MIAIPTWSDEINKALGGGVRGLCEIYGDEGVGKTGLAISTTKHKACFYLDMDGTFPEHLTHLGSRDGIIKTNVFMTPAPIDFKQVSHMAQVGVKHAGYVVIDPIGILESRVISLLAGELAYLCLRYDATILVLNHMDGMDKPKGGKGMSYYATQRLEVRRGETIRKNKKVTGQKIRYRVHKNVNASGWETGEEVINFT